MHRVYIYLYTHASRIIGSEHLSYKIVMDTCQGNIKLGSSIQNYLCVRLHYAGYMHMHVQDILVDRDGKLRYHARPRASLMRCGLTPLCFPTLYLSLSSLPSSLPNLPINTLTLIIPLSRTRINLWTVMQIIYN